MIVCTCPTLPAPDGVEAWLVITDRNTKAIFCAERALAAEQYAVENRGIRYALGIIEDEADETVDPAARS